MKIERVPNSVLFRSHPSGVLAEDQAKGILLGFLYRVTRTRDRRGGATVVGHQPKGMREHETDENGQTHYVDVGGEEILAPPPVNDATGLPESASSLMPNHRADYGWDLALKLVIPPEDFAAALVETDDIPQNEGKTEEQREWQALCFKPKFKLGPNGRAMSANSCRTGTCREDWVGEVEDPCPRCDGTVCERSILDNWSGEEVFCVKENARIMKRVVHQMSAEGMFFTKPRIDEKAAELGTDELVHGQDGMTMGFAPTPKGLRFAEEWVKAHPKFMHGQSLLQAMGPSLAQRAPEWVHAEERHKALVLANEPWF